jgi:hypothetical protein
VAWAGGGGCNLAPWLGRERLGGRAVVLAGAEGTPRYTRQEDVPGC